MKITIAGKRGVLIPDPDGEIQDFIDRHQSLAELCPFGEAPYFTDNRFNASDNTATVPTGYGRPNRIWRPEWFKLNTIFWPVTGACRYGVGIFLVNNTLATAIKEYQTTATGGVPIRITDGLATLELELHPLPLRPISPRVNGEDPIWLFVGVDDRYRWQFCDLGDISLTYSSTWASLFSTIETRLGVTFDPAVDVDTDYSTPNFNEFQRKYQNAAAALDAAAASVGQRVVVKLDGTVTVQKATDADTISQARFPIDAASGSDFINLCAGGGDHSNVQAFPETVVTIFQRHQSGTPQANGDVWRVVTEATAVSSFPGTMEGSKVFNSSAEAEFASDPSASVPDNETDLDALGLKIATDYYAWLDIETYDFCIAGIEPIDDLCGQDDWLSYELGARLDIPKLPEQEDAVDGANNPGERDEGFIVQTRLVSLPINYGVENLLHAFANRRYSPVGMVRVELTESLSSGGSAGANLLYYSGSALVADSRAIKVFDHMGGFDGVTGDRFWATGPVRDSNHFEIVSKVCN